MGKLLLFLSATAVLVGASAKRQLDAPSAEVFGNYTLVSVNEGELPYTIAEEDVTAGSIILRSDWTFTMSLTFRQGDQELETPSFPGTFTLDESNILHFTLDDGDSLGGAWDGNDQITMIEEGKELTFIFRR